MITTRIVWWVRNCHLPFSQSVVLRVLLSWREVTSEVLQGLFLALICNIFINGVGTENRSILTGTQPVFS